MKTETPITLPTVHMNGTGAKDLFDGYRTAMKAVRAAEDAIRKMEFNARDYPQGPTAWKKAKDEMQARRQKLADILAEFMAIAEHIKDTCNCDLY